DVGRPVLAHGPELDEVDRRVDVHDRVEDVQRVDHVVVLRVDGVLLVDHRVRRGPLLSEVHDRLGAERLDDTVGEVRVHEVAGPAGELLARDLLPDLDPALQLGNGDERVDSHLVVVLAAREVVHDAHLVALVGQVQGGRPTEVAVSSEDEDAHSESPGSNEDPVVGSVAAKTLHALPATNCYWFASTSRGTSSITSSSGAPAVTGSVVIASGSSRSPLASPMPSARSCRAVGSRRRSREVPASLYEPTAWSSEPRSLARWLANLPSRS